MASVKLKLKYSRRSTKLNPGVDGEIILKRILMCEGVNYFHMDQWWALVYKVMNLRVPEKGEKFS
jgi:hypothetical protein